VKDDEQRQLARQGLVLSVPEGPEPGAQVGDHARGGECDGLRLEGPDVEVPVEQRAATEIDHGAGGADHTELGELWHKITHARHSRSDQATHRQLAPYGGVVSSTLFGGGDHLIAAAPSCGLLTSR